VVLGRWACVSKQKKRGPKGRPWAGVFFFGMGDSTHGTEKKRNYIKGQLGAGGWAPLGKGNCPIIPTLSRVEIIDSRPSLPMRARPALWYFWCPACQCTCMGS